MPVNNNKVNNYSFNNYNLLINVYYLMKDKFLYSVYFYNQKPEPINLNITYLIILIL